MKIRTLIATTLAAAAAAISIAAPANAAASDCPVNNFCLWTGTAFSGSRYQFTRAAFTGGTSVHNGIRLTSGVTNMGSSFYNRLGSSWSVNIYDSTNCATSPWFRTMVNGQSANAAGSDWDNRVSSIQLQSASPLTC